MTTTMTRLREFRRRTLSAPIFARVKTALPRMSDTEREALEAGTVGWEAEFFSGKPDWSALLAQSPATLTDEERAFLNGPCEQLCAMCDDWDITFNKRDIPEEIWAFLKQHGFLGLIISKDHGGKGFQASAVSAIVAKVSSRSPSVAVAIIVPNSLGPGELLTMFGTDEQKQHYLPRLADGREIPAFALTSVDAGSDATAMTDRGVVCHGTFEGKKTLGIRLNWSKRYISLGPVCTVLGLAFKLSDPEHLLGEEEDIGITMALIPTDTKGVSIGRRHLPGLQAFPNGPNRGTDVFIPIDWVIGGRERVGQGWRMLVTALAAGRGIMLPSMSVSAMKVAAFTTGAYARVREQFNLPIARFEGVQEALARIAGTAYTMDAARVLTARAVDRGERPAVVSAIMKYHATERMRDVVADAMDVHGGKAVCDGPSNYLGSAYRAIPIAITVEGANIMTRSLMIYGQGAIRCHPFILEEMAATQDPDEDAGLIAFDAVLTRHIGFLVKTLVRAAFHAWTFALFAGSPVSGPMARHIRKANALSAAFALVSDAAMVSLGGALKRKEMLSARLGDILSELYLLGAILKRFADDGRAQHDVPLLHWAAESALSRAQSRLDEVLANLPLRPLAWALRVLILPFGRTFRPPSDAATRACAEVLTAPSSARDRLVDGIYIGDPDEPLGQLDRAMRLICELEPLRAKMKTAKLSDIEDALAHGVITDTEAERLHEAQALRRRVLEVDDFDPQELTGTAHRATSAKPPTSGKTKRQGASQSPKQRKRAARANAKAGQST